MNPRCCNAAILRPVESATSRVLEAYFDSDGEIAVSTKEQTQRLDDLVDYIRDLLVEAAEESGIKLGITEYQLFESDGSFCVMGHKRARDIQSSELVCGLDPDPDQTAFITKLSRHPARRTAIGYTQADTIMDIATVLGEMKLPVIENGRFTLAAPHVFAMHTPLYDDRLSDVHPRNQAVAHHALNYPNIPTVSYERELMADLKVSDSPDTAERAVTYLRSDN